MGRPPGRCDPRGFTLVETMIVVVLFTIVVASAMETYYRTVQVEKSVGTTLDLLKNGQMSSLQLTSELRHASEIFYPPPDLRETRPLIIFANEVNDLRVIYVNEKHQLVVQDRNDADKVTVLASDVTRLRVFRKGRRLINYHLIFEEPSTKKTFELLSGLCIRNNIY